MAEPAILLCPVPVLHFCGNRHYIVGFQASGGFAFLLVPALAVHADQKLAAAFLRMMDIEAKRISRDPDTRGYNSMEELTLNCHPFYISFFPVLQKDP